MSGYLENDGDVILDAVLTDEGRRQKAMGTFKITQYAYGDDGINYSLYDSTLNDPTVAIFNLPVYEACPDNYMAQQHKLMSYSKNDYQYLPKMGALTSGQGGGSDLATGDNAGYYVLLCTDAAATKYTGSLPTGFQKANNLGQVANSGKEQGVTLDTGFLNNQSPTARGTVFTELESQTYFIYMNDIFMQLLVPKSGQSGGDVSLVSTAKQAPNFGTDDDNIMQYVANVDANPTFFDKILGMKTESIFNGAFTGPRLFCKLAPSVELQTNSSTWTSTLFPSHTMTNFFPDATSAQVIDQSVLVNADGGVSYTFYVRLVNVA